MNCSVGICASLNKFTCNSGTGNPPCVPARSICDGDNDCSDWSDERYCQTGAFNLFFEGLFRRHCTGLIQGRSQMGLGT